MTPYPGTLLALPAGPGRFRLQVEPDHPAFQGHFPERPILSGLTQLDWAIRLGRDTYGDLGRFEGLEHLKFQAPIGPDEPLELHLTWEAPASRLGFRYSGPAGPKSAGTALFSPAP